MFARPASAMGIFALPGNTQPWFSRRRGGIDTGTARRREIRMRLKS